MGQISPRKIAQTLDLNSIVIRMNIGQPEFFSLVRWLQQEAWAEFHNRGIPDLYLELTAAIADRAKEVGRW
jgi:hypothetical protein